MRCTTTVAACVLAVAVLPACGSGEDETPSAEPSLSVTSPSDPTSATSAPSAETTALDGTWQAHITEDAFVGYAVAQGVRRRDTAAMVERDLPGPEFTLELLDGYFNITGPDGTSWTSGRFEVHGSELHVIESPAFPPFRLAFERSGEQVRFSVAEGQAPGPDHLPGIPMIVAGGALWCSVPWERVA